MHRYNLVAYELFANILTCVPKSQVQNQMAFNQVYLEAV